MRVVSVVFIGLKNVNPEFFVAQGQVDSQRFCAAADCIESVCAKYNGFYKEMVMDDKGAVGLIAFGLPPVVYDDGAVRAVKAAADICAQLHAAGFSCFSFFFSFFFRLIYLQVRRMEKGGTT